MAEDANTCFYVWKNSVESGTISRDVSRLSGGAGTVLCEGDNGRACAKRKHLWCASLKATSTDLVPSAIVPLRGDISQGKVCVREICDHYLPGLFLDSPSAGVVRAMLTRSRLPWEVRGVVGDSGEEPVCSYVA